MKYSNIILLLAGIFAFQAFLPQATLAQKKMEDFRKTAPEPGPAPRITLGEFSQFTLDNGLKVIVVENHKLPRVSFRILVDIPLIREGELAGYRDIAGQLLSKGTKNRSRAELDEEIDFIGASFNTTATAMTGSSLTKHRDKLLEIMSDVLYHPTFPEDEFEKIKTQVISGLQAEKTDPSSIASNVSSVVNYGPNHPYGEIVTEETVEAISLEDARAYYHTYWKPNISYLAIVGDIGEAEARELAETYFGDWEPGEVPVEEISTPRAPEERQVVFVDNTGAVQSVIQVTYPIDLHPANEDVITAELMNNILGGGVFSGYLMQNLREDKGFTYGARSSISPDRYVGNFNASANVRNEVTDSSVHEFLFEMNRIRDEKVDASHLELAKNSMIGQFARSLENPNSLASRILQIARYGLPKDYYETYLEKVNAVSAEDVQRVARKYILPGRANILVVGNKEEVAGSLEKFAADGSIDYRDHYGRPVKASEAIPEGLTASDVIEDYIEALGGAEKLKSVEDARFVYKSSLMGQELVIEILKKRPIKMMMEVTMGGNLMQKQVVNGDVALNTQQGATTTLEGAQLENAQEEALLFKEMAYEDLGYTLELTGMEEIDGQKAYKVTVTSAEGESFTEFYSVETGLKIREVIVQEAQGQTMTFTQEYSDYTDVDGVQVPAKISLTGMAPFPIVQEMETVEFNVGLEDEVFNTSQ